MSDVLMPRLSDSMEEGTILTWLVEDGAAVSAGQELAEIETDKATMTYESQDAGTFEVVVAAGRTVAVGEVIARVGGGAHPAREETSTPEPTAPQPPTAGGPSGNGTGGHLSDAERRLDAQVAATPMARRIAAAHGVTLGQLQGSGPRGRVVRADVLRAAGIAEPAAAPRTTAATATAAAPVNAAAPAAAAAAPAAPGPTAPTPAAAYEAPGPQTETVQPTRLQARIARRMAEAKATIPHFQVQTEVEMTAALQFREQLKAVAAAQELAAPSLNDLIVKACGLALRRFPRANGSYVDGRFELHGEVNVGMAVAADDALVVPVVHGADRLTLGEIAARTRALAVAVREGTVTPPQLSGGTFTVSNLGMYGMTAITPVINPPQAAILGVGAIRDVLARAQDGTIVDRRLLTLTLSCDHRILYGADAARFLGAVAELLQSPAALAL